MGKRNDIVVESVSSDILVAHQLNNLLLYSSVFSRDRSLQRRKSARSRVKNSDINLIVAQRKARRLAQEHEGVPRGLSIYEHITTDHLRITHP